MFWRSHNAFCEEYWQRHLFQVRHSQQGQCQSGVSGERPLTCGHVVQADPEDIDKLAYYLWFAEYAYEAGTEPNLKKVLTSRGKLFPCVCLSVSLLISCTFCIHPAAKALERRPSQGGGSAGWEGWQA